MTETLVESANQLSISQEAPVVEDKHDNEKDEHTVNGDEDESGGGPTHPLEYEWTFWYDKRPAVARRLKGEQDSYENNLRAIGTFGTVEDFWRYYNHLVKPSKLEMNSNYHFFKSGIKPMWEDSENSKGGKWVLTFKDKAMVDACWENVVLGMVGETLDVENEITGAVMSRRKAGDRIAIWNRSKDNEQAIMGVGRKLKAILGVEFNKVQSSYQSHEDSIKSGASYSNPAKYRL